MKPKSITLLALTLAASTAWATPSQGIGPDLSAEVAAQIEAYRAEQQAILEERKAFAESLQGLSVEERRAAIEAFQEDNAERIAAHRSLGENIRGAVSEIRGAHDRERPELEVPGTPGENRPTVTSEAPELTDGFHAVREQILAQKQEILERVRNASDEERQAALAEWREERAALIAQLRQAAREIQADVRADREDRRNSRE